MPNVTTAYRAVQRLAALQVGLSAAYLAVGLTWLASAPPGAEPFRPRDPFLAVLEILIMISAVAFVALVSMARSLVPNHAKYLGAASVALAVVFAGLTCGAHLLQLLVLPRDSAPVTAWLSRVMVVDLLAWDLFFGLALVLLGLAVQSLRMWPHVLFLTAGVLCILGASGPLTGRPRLHLFATLGYAGLFPLACVVLYARLRAL